MVLKHMTMDHGREINAKSIETQSQQLVLTPHTQNHFLTKSGSMVTHCSTSLPVLLIEIRAMSKQRAIT
jgi:hypothetical protein